MKNRILVIPERESRLVSPIQYTVVCPPPSFVRTEIMTVFPDLREICESDKNEEAAKTALISGISAESPLQEGAIHTAVTSSSESSISSSSSLGPNSAVTPSSPTRIGSHIPFSNVSGLPPNKAIFVITTFQPCDCENLTAFTDDTAQFKDWSRERFLDFMALVEKRLGVAQQNVLLHREEPRRVVEVNPVGGETLKETCGDTKEASAFSSSSTSSSSTFIPSPPKPTSTWWVDYPDPASGIPIHSRATSTAFCESDAIELLLKMELMHVNGCRMVVHPKFKENVYPCSAVVYGGGAEELAALLEGL